MKTIYVWKCRKYGREYPENTKTGSGKNDLSVYRNQNGIATRACGDCLEPVDLVPKKTISDKA